VRRVRGDRGLAGCGQAVQREKWGGGEAQEDRSEQTSPVAQAALRGYGIDGDAGAHDESMIVAPVWVRATYSMTSMCPS
jgi:hypothetical protein